MTTGKTIAFSRWTFVGREMSLLFNMLSRLVIAFPSIIRQLLSYVPPRKYTANYKKNTIS